MARDEIWLKNEETARRKMFLTILLLVFTLLVGSSGLKGDPLYYLSFLASSLTYWLLMERQKTQGSILVLLSVFVGFTFSSYLATMYSEQLINVVNFSMLLYAIIFVLIVVGLLPENLLSEWREKARLRA